MQHDYVSKWLKTRQSLMIGLDELINLRPFSDQLAETQERATMLCQALVDYLSFSHFYGLERVFQEITLLNQYHELKTPEFLNQLTENTQAALIFEARHGDQCQFKTLDSDLARLARVLATRFDWEDALINAVQHYQGAPVKAA
jgi:regulator of sigma D